MKISEVNVPKKEIELKGSKYTLGEFNLNILAAIEKKFNTSTLENLEAFSKILASAEGIRFILTQLLKEGGNVLTEEEVGALVGIKELSQLPTVILSIFENAMPDENLLKNSGDQPQEIKE